ncbi:DUF7739 domain-containing protein [Streptosporangium saharense]|uniref:DUF7739 domain-containing protein n=1 Tax=Streptosporangium saharense TaxID=1706840 RepID=A0A7W7VSB4_9ACTN|nr:hypothetical protein [Streptosporangium saharense]MBB4921001.1 hypothetical protein [Streptosporangium saharense]
MGFHFGPRAGTRSYTASADLARKLARKGAGDSTGAAHLLAIMSGQTGGDPQALCPEEAEQAARSLAQAATRLRGASRRITEEIVHDAQAAADSGRSWWIS